MDKDSESPIGPKDDEQTGSVRNGLVGAFFGLGVCLSFVAATQFTQSTYSPSFNGPFFNMWFSTSWMMACYPLYVVITVLVFPERRKRGIRNIYDEDQRVYGERGLTLLTAIKVTGPFLVLWMLTNYVFVRALGITSATVVTTLFVTNTVVVYVLSWILLTEVVAQIPSKGRIQDFPIGGASGMNDRRPGDGSKGRGGQFLLSKKG
ncbi:putative thiamine transporter SLC35F3 [Apostichopus japonicus]|uniref:Putative thiamine transporter SLC35F3 n=1 Tax=Stichopus japonicus TaxID=307972 RepID=A0A2G8LA02_STIJA|nr:putative thiamine transporter SLC35F3 [Apostichopus japonicus]